VTEDGFHQTGIEAIDAYVDDVLEERIPACRWVRLACERHRQDVTRSLTTPWPYLFDAKKAEKVIRYVELLPHVKDEWSGQPLRMRPWQKFILGSLFGWVHKDGGMRRFRYAYICVPRKNSKALAIDTPIPTPVGYKNLRDIHAGDQVIGATGAPVRVLAESPVRFDHACYRVTFSDGSSVVADAGHRWTTRHRYRPWKKPTRYPNSTKVRGNGSGNGGDPVTDEVTTEQIAASVNIPRPDHVIENNHALPETGPIQFVGAHELILPPYVLGAWLGDGDSSGCRITTVDAEIRDRIGAEIGYSARQVAAGGGNREGTVWSFSQPRGNKNPCRPKLRALGVLDNKHIPEQYLTANISARWDLLQGLMDTDGTVLTHNTRAIPRCSYTSMNVRLATDVWRLCRGLGIKATIRDFTATLDNKDCGTAYEVSFPAWDGWPVFSLSRKTEKLSNKKPRRGQTIKIVGCEPVSPVPVKCLTVDADDGLFLAGDGGIATHNSTMSAGIGLYMLTADGEPGAEIYSGATSEKQAWEVFRPAREMAKRRAALLQSAYGLSINAKSLETRDGSRFEPVIGKPGDGASPHCAIIDEYHEHISDELYETMVTGMVARRQPLALVITTAGSDISGPCYTLQLDTQKILEGNLHKDDLFGVVYTIDQDDDWTKPEALVKANPNYDVSVRPLAVISEQKYAVEQSRKQAAFKTKHLNVWVTSRDAWMNLQWWDRQADRTLRREDFAGETCWTALDLSSKYDLTAVVTCFRREQAGDWHYYLFGRYYIPEETAANPDKRHYQQWIADGHLVATDGDIIDFYRIEQDIVADSKRFALAEVAYDPWGATQIAQRLQEEHGLTPVEVPQTTKHLSEPMKMLEALTRTGRVHHDGNPCLAWMISNVTIKEDANENIFPRKDVPDAKIDGAVACIMALGRALAPEAKLADDLLWVTL
jgi:phage terminase large subunit-like protein